MSAEATQVIPAAEVRQLEIERRSVKVRIGERYGIDPDILMGTLRSTVFKGDVTTEQLIMLLVVADQHKLNPFTKEIYAFPSRQGIVPVVGVDGWARIINEHPAFDGMDFEQDDEKCTCRMYRKDRKHPVVVTEYLAECKGSSQPWTTHPKRMLRHKAMIQCARLAFSFAGIYDPDEADRIVEAQNNEPINVTPSGESLEVPEGTNPEKISPRKLREIIEGLIKATENKDGPALLKVWDPLSNEQKLFVWGELRSWERRGIKELETAARKTFGSGDLPSFSLELIKSCKNAAELDEAWRKVQDAFAEADQEVPESVILACDEARSSMGAV